MPRIQDTRELGSAPTLASLGTVREHIQVPVLLALPWMVGRSVWRKTVGRHPVPWSLALGAVVVAVGGWHDAYLWALYALLALTGIAVLTVVATGGASPLSAAQTSLATLSRRKRIRLTWEAWCVLHGLTSAYTGKPMRRQHWMTATPTGLAFDCYPGEAGRAATDVQHQGYRLAALASVERRVFPRAVGFVLGPGRIREVQVRHLSASVARVYVSWISHLDKPLGPADLPPPTLGRVTLGITPDGLPASVPFGYSILLGGETGSGKSTTLHTYVMDVTRQAIPTRWRVADPKGGVELAEYDPERGGMAYRYVSDPRQVAQEFSHFRAGMDRRMASMRRRGVTQHVPTEAEPADIFIIDELIRVMLAYPAGSDLGKQFEQDIIDVLSTGRAACYTVVFLTQLGHAEMLPVWRNMIPVRICMGTRTWQLTDTILGSGATSAGAKCHLISKSEQGQGYFFSEDIRGYQRFKTAHQQDEDKKRIGAGLLPEGVVPMVPLLPVEPDKRTHPGPIPAPDDEGEDE